MSLPPRESFFFSFLQGDLEVLVMASLLKTMTLNSPNYARERGERLEEERAKGSELEGGYDKMCRDVLNLD